MSPFEQVYRVIVKRTPREAFRLHFRTENRDEAIGKAFTWLSRNALRSKGVARVTIDEDDERWLYEAIGDAKGEFIGIVRRYPGPRKSRS